MSLHFREVRSNCILTTVRTTDLAGDDLRRVPGLWTSARLADAAALVNIESSFYKLVGGRRLGFLDPAFLRLLAHLAVGEDQACHKMYGTKVCG